MQRIKAHSLTDNVHLLTAWANDASYDMVFAEQMHNYVEPGDVVIAISGSGNSPNVVEAAHWVKDQGGCVMALTGFDGGQLAKIADVAIHAETEKGQYGPVEDVHMIMDHLIMTWMLKKHEGV